ncbi:MAG: NnrS family protein [Hyphomicrobiaceae bacterium]
MTTSAAQIRAFTGPALLSYGFRPFFLFGALWAALAVALWIPILTGHLVLPSALGPVQWHVHELVFGYVPAIVAGFLLTAVPNWTGRLPVVGTRLATLFLVWVAGRIAIFCSLEIGIVLAAVIDLSFLAALGLLIAREILASKNTHNLKVLAGVGLLLLGNALFHLEAIAGFGDGHGTRVGVAAIVLLIMLIGGRIIPSFTRNWLARRGAGRMPAPFDRFDLVVMVASGIALATWVVMPSAIATAAAAAIAAALNVTRLGRWAGERTTAEPLVLILHIAYAFVPIGFALLALAIVRPDIAASSGALHGWTTGAIGVMTLAVMTRASLGHTGQPLTATRSIQFIYLAAVVAALARITVAFDILHDPMLHLAATAWVLAFGGFVIVYAPLLMRRRT